MKTKNSWDSEKNLRCHFSEYCLVLNVVIEEPNYPTEFLLRITTMSVRSLVSVISLEFSWDIVGGTLHVTACVPRVMSVYGLSFQLGTILV